MDELIKLINDKRSFLLKRVVEYAKQHGYVKYTSTLEEAWIASINGLSKAMCEFLESSKDVPEIPVDYNFHDDKTSFGVLEAQKHRSRGISLVMFLSLMKYYRQAYLDLVQESISDFELKDKFHLAVLRFFDFTEIAFCSEWNSWTSGDILNEMQEANRKLTNEKNKYLTIYESIPTAALIFDSNHHCTNMNYSAQKLLNLNINAPGYVYYSDTYEKPFIGDILPWLKNSYFDYCSRCSIEELSEICFESPNLGKRSLQVIFHKVLDISDKFAGTVILLHDMTEYKKIEDQLRDLSFHDQLTGLYNRAYLEEEILRLSKGRDNPVAFISIDVDGLKLVNDNLGHNAGDSLLISVSRLIRNCFRENDVIARVGGDEFMIIITSCEADIVEMLCRKLRLGIEQYNKKQVDYPMSLSVGWSIGYLFCTSNSNELIKKADANMYSDKKINRKEYQVLFSDFISKSKRITT